MNYLRIEQSLIQEISRIEKYLEGLRKTLADIRDVSYPQPEPRPEKRGRKSMGPAERQIVSARMRQYWASRQDRERADALSVERNMRG